MRVHVPYLTLKEIERSADELLAQYSAAHGALGGAIDVDFVIERMLGLELAVMDLKGLLGNPDVLGATVVDQERVYVDQSLEKNPGRFSFTLAHEVGHWVLHRPHLATHPEGSALFDLSEFVEPQPATAPGRKPRVEWQADQFADCLLMPGKLVRAAVHDAFGGRLPTWEGIQSRLQARQLRALRAIAVGRKAWLFVGSDDAAQSASSFFSLIATCRLHDLEPEAYLRDLFRVLPHWPKERYLELAPLFFKATRARLDPAELATEIGAVTVPPAIAA